MLSQSRDETLELHVWGPVNDVLSLSPECLAAIWYIKSVTGKEHSFKIVPSSNTTISSSGKQFFFPRHDDELSK